MSSSLVIAKTFWSSIDANVAKAQLQGAGLECLLADEHTVTMDWTLCNAIGGVKLMVAAEDLAQVQSILAQKYVPEVGEEEEDFPKPKRSLREEMAKDALRAAELGCLFFPISMYALWLALKAMFASGPLDGVGKWHVFLALLLVAPVLIITAAFVVVIAVPVSFVEFPHLD